ncbi:MAG: twitching motility protein PilT [Opitutales bacterium]|nr:twitching motility protein PilT [Opitutales bacterium]
MKHTVNIIRAVFFIVCVLCGYLLAYTIPEWDDYRWVAVGISAGVSLLVILIDVMLKGFSLRGFSAVTFGMFLGWLAAALLSSSPLFDQGDPQILYLTRIALFLILSYAGAVIALRGKDEFNIVIPYVRFAPQQVDSPLAVVDASALIDGRIVGICESRFMGFSLVIPTFIIEELHRIADSRDIQRRERGRRGLETLNKLRAMPYVDIHIHESDVSRKENIEAKLIFVTTALKAKLLTTDYNLAQVAKFHNVEWLNLNTLARCLRTECVVGQRMEVDLVKEGRDPDQGVGYLSDGSMVVVTDGHDYIGRTVLAEVQNILPSAGGRMVFATLVPDSWDEDTPVTNQKRVKP